MIVTLLLAALAAEEPVPLEVADTAPVAEDAGAGAKKGGWFSQIRYGVGVSNHFGWGTDGTTFGRNVVAEPVTFELRSFLWPRVAFHTTLYLGRMIAPALREEPDGRIDYGCHLGAHLPVGAKLNLVVAPGADIAYSFTKSRYQRIVGDSRLGVDLVNGRWTTGFYLRPYGGWWRDVGEEKGRAVGGVLFEVANIFMVPKKSERTAAGR